MQSILTAVQSTSLSQRLLLLALSYCASAALIFPRAYAMVLGSHTLLQMAVLIAVILMAGLLAVTLLHQPRSPISFMAERLAGRGLAALTIIATLFLCSSAFTAYKYEYTVLVPFFADPVIAAMDRAIRFGDPWQWLRAVFPAALDYPLFLLYSVGWFMEVILGVAIAAFLTDRPLRERYLASFAIGIMLLSSVVRVVANSAGPILYDRIHGGVRFAGLTEALKTSPSGHDTLAIANYLYDSYASGESLMGTGISAMPSLHVALAFLNALFFGRLGSKARIAGWAYFATVLFGSVYFGWHYALDGYVSIAVIWSLWRLFAPAAQERASA